MRLSLIFVLFAFLQCVYPLGATDNASLIVKRQASEVSNLRRKRKKKQKQGETEVRFVSKFFSRLCLLKKKP